MTRPSATTLIVARPGETPYEVSYASTEVAERVQARVEAFGAETVIAHSDAGVKEVEISGTCEWCWDHMFPAED